MNLANFVDSVQVNRRNKSVKWEVVITSTSLLYMLVRAKVRPKTYI